MADLEVGDQRYKIATCKGPGKASPPYSDSFEPETALASHCNENPSATHRNRNQVDPTTKLTYLLIQFGNIIDIILTCLKTLVSLEDVRSIILALLVHCEIPYVVKPYDQYLHDCCLAVCEDREYPIGSKRDPVSNEYASHRKRTLAAPLSP